MPGKNMRNKSSGNTLWWIVSF